MQHTWTCELYRPLHTFAQAVGQLSARAVTERTVTASSFSADGEADTITITIDRTQCRVERRVSCQIATSSRQHTPTRHFDLITRAASWLRQRTLGACCGDTGSRICLEIRVLLQPPPECPGYNAVSISK
jgi:hypothetical protein